MDDRTACFQLHTLGGFALAGPEGAVDLRGHKLRALLAYLVSAAGEPQSRERLTALLWGSYRDPQARQNLRAALTRLRRLMGREVVESGDATVTLPQGLIASDARQLAALAMADDLGALEAASQLYGGEFLAGVSVREAAWEDWLRGERERLRTAAIGATLRLGEMQLARRCPADALASGLRVVALDALREDAHRLVMRALADLGRQAEAVRHYAVLSARLKDDLGVAPSAETTRLRDAIKRRATAPATVGPDTPPKPTIAVLPFINAGTDGDHDLFCDGVSEDIITELARFRDLAVTDRGSSFALKGQAGDLERIRERLAVQYLVEGSVRRYGKRLRITAQLIDADSGTEIWAERYDRDLADIFDLEDELVRTIAATLVGWLERRGRERAKQKPTTSLVAYEHLIQGRAHFFRMLPEENKIARKHFEQAVAIDGDYAAAQAWLAETHLGDWAGGWTRAPRESLAEGFDCAVRAVFLDDTDSRTHATLGRAYLWRLEFDKARYHYERALSLNPSDVWALASSARCHILEGQPQKGLRQILDATRLNPLGSYGYQLGIAHYALGDYDTSARVLGGVRDPIDLVYAWLAASLARSGRPQDAKRAVADFLRAFRRRSESLGVAAPQCAGSFLVERYPFRKEQDLAHFFDGLRLAGLEI